MQPETNQSSIAPVEWAILIQLDVTTKYGYFAASQNHQVLVSFRGEDMLQGKWFPPIFSLYALPTL